MFNLFKKKEMNKMVYLMDCMLENTDDLLEDVDDLHTSIEESNKLLATIQQQCQEIIKIMEGHEPDEKTLDTYYVRDEEGSISNIYTLAKLKDGNYVHIYDSLGSIDKTISINAIIAILGMDDKKLSQLFNEDKHVINLGALHVKVETEDDEKRNYYIVKDDLGMVYKKAYLGEENGEEDKDVQGNGNFK